MEELQLEISCSRTYSESAIEIDASHMDTRELNSLLREIMLSGYERAVLRNVCGQRYIGTRLYSPERRVVTIEIYGTPGNDLGAFLFGHRVLVHGNAQDGVGNTMESGEIVIEGRAGDVTGMSMRGGRIFVQGDVGYRAALHMKEHDQKRPVIVVGGTSQDFLGEYMAGGMVILLGLYGAHTARFIGSGMHGGAIYLRGSIREDQVDGHVLISRPDDADRELLGHQISGFLERFPDLSLERDDILECDWTKLSPRSSRPYGKLYA
ncbi:MAG: hypothetical protein NQU42_07150 [Methanothrix sp.]|uniref:GltB/FmdC/FwdC-like GXGXG domain-containing protein n=1 Tax=Methanothrix sp. TaxID=90426 RepID=UPI0025DAB8B5|nr:hypothetical protein [Methanothrix sp.]MCQ8903849.1 hypothetical protein [Methanothrix sp.]